MGSLNSGRPGGNPDFGKKFRIPTTGDEPYSKFIGLRLTATMNEKLDRLLGDRKMNFIREAIQKSLEELEETS
jgi:hypothetical protein